MQAVLPSHPNLNRFLGEFVSDVPDDMFAALSPVQQELGAWAGRSSQALLCVRMVCFTNPTYLRLQRLDLLCLFRVCVCAGTTVNRLTGASKRSKAQFMLMDYFPGTLQAYVDNWHGRCTPVPYKQAVAILAGVRVSVFVCAWVCMGVHDVCMGVHGCVCVSPCDGGPLAHICLV